MGAEGGVHFAGNILFFFGEDPRSALGSTGIGSARARHSDLTARRQPLNPVSDPPSPCPDPPACPEDFRSSLDTALSIVGPPPCSLLCSTRYGAHPHRGGATNASSAPETLENSSARLQGWGRCITERMHAGGEIPRRRTQFVFRASNALVPRHHPFTPTSGRTVVFV